MIFQVGAQRARHVVREPLGERLLHGLRLRCVQSHVVQCLGIAVRVDEDALDVGLDLAVLRQVDGRVKVQVADNERPPGDVVHIVDPEVFVGAERGASPR